MTVVEVVEGGLPAPDLCQNRAAQKQRVGVTRPHLERLGEIGDRRVSIVPERQRRAAVAIGPPARGLQLDRAVVVGDGGIELFQLRARGAAVVVAERERGIEAQCFIERFDRLCVLLLSHQERRPGVVDARVLGRLLPGLVQLGVAFLPTLRVGVLDGAEDAPHHITRDASRFEIAEDREAGREVGV